MADRSHEECRRLAARHRQLAQRYSPGKRGTSRYKGVHRDEKWKQWVAAIRLNGRNEYLGHHDFEDDAARAYDAKAREAFDGDCWLNIPNPTE